METFFIPYSFHADLQVASREQTGPGSDPGSDCDGSSTWGQQFVVRPPLRGPAPHLLDLLYQPAPDGFAPF